MQQTKVDQAAALLALKVRQQDALSVRAGIDGVEGRRLSLGGGLVLWGTRGA